MQYELTPAQRKLQAKARELASGHIAERAAEVDRSEEYPWDNIAVLKDAGFFGMTIPRAYGGAGASYLDVVLIIGEMAKCCGITGRIVVEANMGAIGAIMKYGSDAQKRLAADLVLSGDKPAICPLRGIAALYSLISASLPDASAATRLRRRIQDRARNRRRRPEFRRTQRA